MGSRGVGSKVSGDTGGRFRGIGRDAKEIADVEGTEAGDDFLAQLRAINQKLVSESSGSDVSEGSGEK